MRPQYEGPYPQQFTPLKVWAQALSEGKYIATQTDALRYKDRVVDHSFVGESPLERLFGEHSKHFFPEKWTYSPAGVLCDVYMQYVKPPEYYGRWVEGAFVCPPLRPDTVVDGFVGRWPIPTPVKSWWYYFHKELRLAKLKPLMEDAELSFEQLSVLLMTEAPWAH